MNIEELTIKEAREIAALFNSVSPISTSPTTHGAIGKKCIVRTYASGVHFGEVVSISSNEGRSRCELKNSRRLWKWHGGLSLSEVSVKGIIAEKSRVSTTVAVQFLEDAIEFIPATSESITSIEAAKDDNC